MNKRKFVPPVVDYSKVNKDMAQPDQSLSIQEIVRRYVRGIPVDVVQRQPVYSDQTEFDLEAVSRMDFHDKAELAARLRERADRIEREYKRREDELREDEQAKQSAKKEAANGSQPPGDEGAGNT